MSKRACVVSGVIAPYVVTASIPGGISTGGGALGGWGWFIGRWAEGGALDFTEQTFFGLAKQYLFEQVERLGRNVVHLHELGIQTLEERLQVGVRWTGRRVTVR